MASTQDVESRCRVGIDIGGTFTDGVLVNSSGELTTAKVSTTPANYADGFTHALNRVLSRARSSSALTYIAHGSTVATNALVQATFGRVGLLTTAGFRDVLEIGTQQRGAIYDLHAPKIAPLVPRELRLEVRERTGPRGEIVDPLEIADVVAAAEIFTERRVDSVAVCLLFAFANPAHEREIEAILSRHLPGVPISLSSRVAPEIREFPRTSTTVINAALLPIVGSYLRGLEDRLEEDGITLTPYIMRSNGGVAPSKAAAPLTWVGPPQMSAWFLAGNHSDAIAEWCTAIQ
jgi:N-methylhydantoinase A